MKNIKRFSAVIGAAALLAFAFTGCDTFAGTELNYGEKEAERVGASGDTVNLGSASISWAVVNQGTFADIDEVSTQTTIKVTITNKTSDGSTGAKIDLKSAEKAIAFYSVKNNDKAGYYNVRDAVLPATLHGTTESATTGNANAILEFEVDTSSVRTSKIALVVDATKLKDKSGKAILNLDENYKRGEETDNYIDYISVYQYKDGDTLKDVTALTGISEDFRPEDPYTNKLWTPITGTNFVYVVDDEYHPTGEIIVTVSSSYVKTYGEAAENDETLADKLNKSYSVQIRKPASTSYSTKSLSFSWNDKNNRYEASVGTSFEPGTYMELWAKKVEYTSPDWFVEMFGHKAFTSDKAIGAKSYVGGTTANVYVESPDYVVENYSATEVEWTPAFISEANIVSAQKNWLKVSYSNGKFTLTPAGTPGKVTLVGKDFIIVDKKIVDDHNNANPNDDDVVEYKLPFKMTEKKLDGDNGEDSGKTAYYEFEITNKNIKLYNPVLYVGSGTSLEENTRNATQKKFGMYKDATDGIHSGYVALN